MPCTARVHGPGLRMVPPSTLRNAQHAIHQGSAARAPLLPRRQLPVKPWSQQRHAGLSSLICHPGSSTRVRVAAPEAAQSDAAAGATAALSKRARLRMENKQKVLAAGFLALVSTPCNAITGVVPCSEQAGHRIALLDHCFMPATPFSVIGCSLAGTRAAIIACTCHTSLAAGADAAATAAGCCSSVEQTISNMDKGAGYRAACTSKSRQPTTSCSANRHTFLRSMSSVLNSLHVISANALGPVTPLLCAARPVSGMPCCDAFHALQST